MSGREALITRAFRQRVMDRIRAIEARLRVLEDAEISSEEE